MKTVSLSSRSCSFIMEENGSFTLKTPAAVLRNGHAEALIDGEKQCLCFLPENVSDRSGRFTAETEKGQFIFEVTAGETLTLRLSCRLKAFPKTIELAPLCLPEVKADHVSAQGRKMGSCFQFEFPRTVSEGEKYSSHFHTGFRFGKQFLFLSTPLRKRLHSEFSGKPVSDGLREFRAFCGTCHEDSLEFSSDDLTIQTGEDLFGMVTRWSEDNVEVKRNQSPLFAPGWNSWDYYRWTVTEEQVLANADFIRKDPVLSKYVKRIIVDDGWEYCYGEWDPNPLFPHGMKYLAEELTKMGFEPGLWMAPAIVEPQARIAQIHSDWCAQGESGQVCLGWECMRRRGAVLDPTIPEVKKHLFDLFDRYASYGYRYFKLDFLAGVLQARQYRDRTVPHSDMVRLIVEQAYKASAGRALIMGCNYTFDSGNRYVDACRIGADIHAAFRNIRNNSVSIGSNFWGTGRQWLGDPDFALCRTLETHCDPELNTLNCNAVFGELEGPRNPEIDSYRAVDDTEEETKILLSLVLISGGAVNLSDRMDRLNEAGLKLARKTVSAVHGGQGRALDLYETEHASQWVQDLPDGRKRLLLINWTEEEREFSFDLRTLKTDLHRITDFWAETEIPVTPTLVKKLKPHTCLLAEIE